MVFQLNGDDHALKHNADEENDWHSLQPLGLWFVDYTTCYSDVRVCGVHSVSQVLDQQLTRQEEGWEDNKGKNEEEEEEYDDDDDHDIFWMNAKQWNWQQSTCANLISRTVLL